MESLLLVSQKNCTDSGLSHPGRIRMTHNEARLAVVGGLVVWFEACVSGLVVWFEACVRIAADFPQ